MKKRIVAFIIAICLIVMTFSGCEGLNIRSVESLMRPPLAYKVDRELKVAFESFVTKKTELRGIALLPPSAGDYRSAFIMHDIDLDGEDEALVFYSAQNESSKAHMNVLNRNGDKWRSVADFSISGKNINFVRFVQMSENNCPVIIVSHSIYESRVDKALSVFVSDTEKGEIKNIFSEAYTVMENMDVDSDGLLDIFLIQQDFTDLNMPEVSASVLKMNDENKLEKLGSAKIDSGVSTYLSVKTEKVNASSPMRIYVDALKGENHMMTEVIYWNSVSKKLVTPMLDEDTQSNIITRREEKLASQDFDGDGIIEIPSQSMLLGSKKYLSTKNLYQQMYLTQWIEVKNETEYTLTPTVVNARDSYIVYYNDMKKLIGNFTIYDFESKKMWVFKEFNNETHDVGEELFTLIRVTDEEAQKRKIPKNRYIIEDENCVIYFSPTKRGTSSGITAEKIKECIKTFKE